MKLLKNFTLTILVFACSYANAQVDAIKIASAKNAYEAKDYNAAIIELNTVSAVGKKSKLYLYYKGYSFYNLQQLDSARKYLKKYLILDVENKKVFESLTEIENRLKWFSTRPPRQETIDWLKSKIDNKESNDKPHFDKVGNKFRCTDYSIIADQQCWKEGDCYVTYTLNIDDIYNVLIVDSYKYGTPENPHTIADDILIITFGDKITSYLNKSKIPDKKTHVFGLQLDYDAEPGLINKMYKALSNIALENVKNMPKETY